MKSASLCDGLTVKIWLETNLSHGEFLLNAFEVGHKNEVRESEAWKDGKYKSKAECGQSNSPCGRVAPPDHSQFVVSPISSATVTPKRSNGGRLS